MIGQWLSFDRILTRPNVIRIGLTVVAFAIIITVSALVRAAPGNVEAEAGTGSGTLNNVSDTSASNGQAVQFGTVSAAAGSLGYARIPWEGGSSYWKVANGARFAKADTAGWDDPSFFPITVFLGKASSEHVTLLKDAGINTYAPAEHSPAIYPLTNITSQGMFVIANLEYTQAEVGTNPGVVGWFISDECDMGLGGCSEGGDGQDYNLAMQTQWTNQTRAYNDGRFAMANFGNGIIRTFWATNTMEQHVRMMDVASADKYTYTSPDVEGIIDGWHDAPDWPNGVPVSKAYSYGWQADQMRRFEDPTHLRPVWTFVESAQPYLSEPGAHAIGLNQIGGAVWSALRHEARGISYFQHNNASSGCTGNYSIAECSDVRNAVKAVNAKVKSLAPVLNTQSYYNATRVVNGFTYQYFTFNNGTDTMLKTYNGSAYIFAGLGMRCNNTTCTSGTADTTGSKTFTVPSGVTGTSVEVVGESRTLPITSGQFTDTFAQEYTDHVYRISL